MAASRINPDIQHMTQTALPVANTSAPAQALFCGTDSSSRTVAIANEPAGAAAVVQDIGGREAGDERTIEDASRDFAGRILVATRHHGLSARALGVYSDITAAQGHSEVSFEAYQIALSGGIDPGTANFLANGVDGIYLHICRVALRRGLCPETTCNAAKVLAKVAAKILGDLCREMGTVSEELDFPKLAVRTVDKSLTLFYKEAFDAVKHSGTAVYIADAVARVLVDFYKFSRTVSSRTASIGPEQAIDDAASIAATVANALVEVYGDFPVEAEIPEMIQRITDDVVKAVTSFLYGCLPVNMTYPDVSAAINAIINVFRFGYRKSARYHVDLVINGLAAAVASGRAARNYLSVFRRLGPTTTPRAIEVSYQAFACMYSADPVAARAQGDDRAVYVRAVGGVVNSLIANVYYYCPPEVAALGAEFVHGVADVVARVMCTKYCSCEVRGEGYLGASEAANTFEPAPKSLSDVSFDLAALTNLGAERDAAMRAMVEAYGLAQDRRLPAEVMDHVIRGAAEAFTEAYRGAADLSAVTNADLHTARAAADAAKKAVADAYALAVATGIFAAAEVAEFVGDVFGHVQRAARALGVSAKDGLCLAEGAAQVGVQVVLVAHREAQSANLGLYGVSCVDDVIREGFLTTLRSVLDAGLCSAEAVANAEAAARRAIKVAISVNIECQKRFSYLDQRIPGATLLAARQEYYRYLIGCPECLVRLPH